MVFSCESKTTLLTDIDTRPTELRRTLGQSDLGSVRSRSSSLHAYQVERVGDHQRQYGKRAGGS